jgi:hypothetical protein
MVLDQRAHGYPAQQIRVVPFPAEFSSLLPRPGGLIESEWPPLQMVYLGEYLAALGCKTVVIEDHYIDRDYIDDVALFYSRSLRAYPNFCYRLHFFASDFDQQRWRDLVATSDAEGTDRATQFLQTSYRGFSVIRPLPGAPVGRTVLPTFPEPAAEGRRRVFGGVREYAVHLAGFTLQVRGLAFQQQDQGVSACATTALWSALHHVARLEGLRVPTAADINLAASRYVLEDGRPLPAAGLSIYQICEATRSAGLAPLLIQGVSLDHDRAQILAYTCSGFPPVLAIQPLSGGDGHAVCGVGVKLGDVAPQTDPNLHHRDASSAVQGVYIHDDRLGPYASASLYAYTKGPDDIRTALKIRWPNKGAEWTDAVLKAIMVPVPTKLRLTVTRMRELAFPIAETAGKMFPQFGREVTMNCVYRLGTAYREAAIGLGLSADGLYTLRCGVALSRYVGVIEITVPDGPLFNFLLDATETQANPSVLACVKGRALPPAGLRLFEKLAKLLSAPCLI